MKLEDLSGKRIGVAGFGQEGQALVAYLKRHGHNPVLFDRNENIQTESLKTFLGKDYLAHLDQVDILFRSPGIWRLAPELLTAEKQGLVITSQVQWFFDNCPTPIIGITGTKGKGTTASIIYHLLQPGSKRVVLTGNIGQDQPVDLLGNISKDDLVVYELSSFQLQDLTKSPHIAVILMVTEDHLDIHASVDEYHHAKEAISKFQSGADFTIINDDFEISKNIGQRGTGQKYYFSRQREVNNGAFVQGSELVIKKSGREQFRIDLTHTNLRGEFNRDNIAAGVLAAWLAGASPDQIKQQLPSFVQTLPHRLQHLPDQSGIQFYDDSISTVPHTTAAAITAFTEPLILIIGGADKGLSPEPLVQGVVGAKNIKAVVTIGTTGPILAEALRRQNFGGQILERASNMEQAMRQIKQIAKTGDLVLLSPGYYSFDWYSNYKERGLEFARLAKQWDLLKT